MQADRRIYNHPPLDKSYSPIISTILGPAKHKSTVESVVCGGDSLRSSNARSFYVNLGTSSNGMYIGK